MTNLDPSEDDAADDAHPPLARDASGNRVAVPEGTDSLKVQVDTGGRPNTIKQGIHIRRFSLRTTLSDLFDEFGHGTYRISALDKLGGDLGLITVLTTGFLPRNGAASSHAANSNDTMTNATDWRYALETIAGIARTNAEALRAVADSQADWVKTIAMAKGLPRNVAMYRPGVVELQTENDDSDDDDSDNDDDEQLRNAAPDVEEPAPPAASANAQVASAVTEQVMKALVPLLTSLGALLSNKINGVPAPSAAPVIDVPAAPESTPSTSGPMVHLARIQQQLNVEERAILSNMLADPETGAQVASELAAMSVEDAVAQLHAVSRGPRPQKSRSRRPPVSTTPAVTPSPAPDLSAIPTLDPNALLRMLEIRNALTPDEQTEIASVLTTLSASERLEWSDTLAKLDLATAIQRVRTELAAKRNRNTNPSK